MGSFSQFYGSFIGRTLIGECDEAVLVRVDDQLQAVRDAEFFED